MDKIAIIENTLGTSIEFSKRFLMSDQDHLMGIIEGGESIRLSALQHAIKQGYVTTISASRLKTFLLSSRENKEMGIYKFNDEMSKRFILLKLIIMPTITWSGYCFKTGDYQGLIPSFHEAIRYNELASIGGYALDEGKGVIYNINKIKEFF